MLTFPRQQILFSLLLLLLSSLPAVAENPRDSFTFLLPAPALQQTLQQNLPFTLRPAGSSFTGTLTVDSIDSLRIHDNIISLHGVLSGRDMALATEIAGRKIKLKLGQVTLPVSCDLHLRFDPKNGQLYFRPRFTSTGTQEPSIQSLLPLLTSLGDREYPIDLNELSTLRPVIDGNQLNMKLRPTRISGIDNQLIIGLQPLKK